MQSLIDVPSTFEKQESLTSDYKYEDLRKVYKYIDINKFEDQIEVDLSKSSKQIIFRLDDNAFIGILLAKEENKLEEVKKKEATYEKVEEKENPNEVENITVGNLQKEPLYSKKSYEPDLSSCREESRDAEEDVNQRVGLDRSVLQVLNNLKYDFYTVKAISNLTKLLEEEVSVILDRNSRKVRTALVKQDGLILYTSANRPKKLREHLSELVFYFKRSFDPYQNYG